MDGFDNPNSQCPIVGQQKIFCQIYCQTSFPMLTISHFKGLQLNPLQYLARPETKKWTVRGHAWTYWLTKKQASHVRHVRERGCQQCPCQRLAPLSLSSVHLGQLPTHGAASSPAYIEYWYKGRVNSCRISTFWINPVKYFLELRSWCLISMSGWRTGWPPKYP